MLDLVAGKDRTTPLGMLRSVFPMITHNIAEIGVRIADLFNENIVPNNIQKATSQQNLIYEQAKASVENNASGSKLTGQAKTNAINNVAKQYKDAQVSLPLNIYVNPEKVKEQTSVMFPVGPKNEYFNTGAGRFTTAINPETGQKYVGSDQAGGLRFIMKYYLKLKMYKL